MLSSKIEVLRDSEGAVELGWVAPGVFLARVVGALSGTLGGLYAARVLQALTESPRMHYFCDASRLTQYDLTARSAFFRVALSRREKFASMTILTWAEGVSPAARSFSQAMGEHVDLLVERHEFETRLLRVAPAARDRVLALHTTIAPSRRA